MARSPTKTGAQAIACQRLPTSNAAMTAQLAGTSRNIQSIHIAHPTSCQPIAETI
jgi:hypothetical protein